MAEPVYNRYLALPPSGKGPGVLVLHAWWGLNDTFREVCDRLARAGFVAFAPDLFSGEVARTVAEAEQHLQRYDEEHAAPPILLDAVEALRHHPAVSGDGLGVVGFSMGAYWSLWLAEQMPDLFRAVTIFYGTNGGGGDFSQSKAAFLGNFAEKDPYETEESVQALEANLKSAGRPVDFYTYPNTGHWFFEPDRPDAYDARSAELAWERLVAFLRQALGGTGVPPKNTYLARASVTVRAPAAEVWQALTDPALIKQYLFGTDVTTDWQAGSPITYRGVWQGKPYEDKGRILAVEPGRRLVTTFWSALAGLPDAPENYQTITYALEESGGANEVGETRLSLTQDNNPTEADARHSEQNWNMVLDGLKKLVEGRAA